MVVRGGSTVKVGNPREREREREREIERSEVIFFFFLLSIRTYCGAF